MLVGNEYEIDNTRNNPQSPGISMQPLLLKQNTRYCRSGVVAARNLTASEVCLFSATFQSSELVVIPQSRLGTRVCPTIAQSHQEQGFVLSEAQALRAAETRSAILDEIADPLFFDWTTTHHIVEFC